MIKQKPREQLSKSLKEIGRLKIGEGPFGAFLFFENRPHDKFLIQIPDYSDRLPMEIIEAFEEMADKANAFEEMSQEIADIFKKEKKPKA